MMGERASREVTSMRPYRLATSPFQPRTMPSRKAKGERPDTASSRHGRRLEDLAPRRADNQRGTVHLQARPEYCISLCFASTSVWTPQAELPTHGTPPDSSSCRCLSVAPSRLSPRRGMPQAGRQTVASRVRPVRLAVLPRFASVRRDSRLKVAERGQAASISRSDEPCEGSKQAAIQEAIERGTRSRRGAAT